MMRILYKQLAFHKLIFATAIHVKLYPTIPFLRNCAYKENQNYPVKLLFIGNNKTFKNIKKFFNSLILLITGAFSIFQYDICMIG